MNATKRKRSRYSYYNMLAEPITVDDGGSRAREFARRLSNYMLGKGWHQSKLAREASRHHPSGPIGRDAISNYVRGLHMPRPPVVHAIARALGVTSRDLLPDMPSVARPVKPFGATSELSIEVLGDRVRVRLNKEFPIEDLQRPLAELLMKRAS